MNLVFAREAQEASKNLTRWQEFKLKVFGSKLVVDYEFSADRVAKYPLYLFWCNECSHYSKSRRSGKYRLYCSSCSAISRLPASRYKESESVYYEVAEVLPNKTDKAP